MRYGLALGSNLGDRRANLTEARRLLLAETSDPESLLCAGLHESEPVDCEPGCAPFLNTCLEMEFDKAPAELLRFTRGVEETLGRPASRPVNAPRTLDIDILYAGDRVVAEPDLEIPHPRLTKRRFVLLPLAEIRPELVLPGNTRSIAELLRELDSDEPSLVLTASEW